MELPSDAEIASLVRSAQHKDPGAFGQLYGLFAEPLFRYFYFRTNDRLVSEELVSEVFLKVVEAIGKFQLPKRSQARTFSGWIFRIAYNKVVDAYRGRKREVVELDESISASFTAHEQVDRMLENKELRAAIQRLTPEQQQVVRLRFFEGMSNEEVAQVMGLTVGAVKAMQHRALLTIDKLMREGHEVQEHRAVNAIAKLMREERKAQEHRDLIAIAELIGEAA